MSVSNDLSLNSYIEIADPAGSSFGGSQSWFPTDQSKADRLIHREACGLIAAADLLLYISRKERLSLEAVTGIEGFRFPDSRASYRDYIRALRRHYPLFPKIGSFNAEIPLFVNHVLRQSGSGLRLRRALPPTKRAMLKTVRRSLEKERPLILLIAPKVLPFTKMKGVPFYTFREGLPVKITSPVRAHFVTVTGLLCPLLTELPLFYEISSWGKKYYINSDELAEYTARACLPLAGSLFCLTHPSD